jgi:hypothetical protein
MDELIELCCLVERRQFVLWPRSCDIHSALIWLSCTCPRSEYANLKSRWRPSSLSRESMYLTTDSQSASLSWCQATIMARDQLFFLLEIFRRQLRVSYFMAPSLTRGQVCDFLFLVGLASAAPLGSESRAIQYHILLSQFLRLPSLESRVTVFISPRDKVAQLHPGTGFPFRRLLRLAGLRWRYSNQPPHGLTVYSGRSSVWVCAEHWVTVDDVMVHPWRYGASYGADVLRRVEVMIKNLDP